MHNTLFIALLAGLGGMIGWGGADFFAKKTVDRIGPIKSLVWAHLFGSSFFVMAALIQVTVLKHAVHIPMGITAWAGLLFFGVLQMIVYWLAYAGFEKGQLAVLNPVFASYSGIVALASLIFFGEKLHLALGVALIAIFIGIVCLNLDLKGLGSKKLKIAPGLKEVSGAALGAAIWTLGWDKFISGHDSLSYALWMYIFMTCAAFVIAKAMKVRLQGIESGLWKFLALMGLGETLAYLTVSWGYGATSLTSIVALVSGAFSVPTVILAYVFLKERLSTIQVVGILITIAGIIGISAY